MKFYELLEKPQVYNWNMKIFSLNNKTLLGCLDRLIDAQEGDRILDVGCGTGKYAIFKKGYYLGIDPNGEYIDYAQKNHAGEFLVMDARNIALADNSFNKVFCLSTFHHIADEDTEKIIQEMKRICQPGGYVYAIDAVYPRNLLGDLLFKLDRGRYQKSFRQLNDFLSRRGFKVVTEKVKKTFPYRWAVFSYQKPN
ncbi:MAG: class I SAM-dependent methyltransferase [bacterium]